MKKFDFQPIPGIDFYLVLREAYAPTSDVFSGQEKASPVGKEGVRLTTPPFRIVNDDGSMPFLNPDVVREQFPKDKNGEIKKLPKSFYVLEYHPDDNPNIPRKLVEFIVKTLQLSMHTKLIYEELAWKTVINKIENDPDLKETIEAALFDNKILKSPEYTKLLNLSKISDRVISDHLSEIKKNSAACAKEKNEGNHKKNNKTAKKRSAKKRNNAIKKLTPEKGVDTAIIAEPGTEAAPQATEPKATEPQAIEPKATEPQATEPDATNLEAEGPEARVNTKPNKKKEIDKNQLNLAF